MVTSDSAQETKPVDSSMVIPNGGVGSSSYEMGSFSMSIAMI